jgi:FkbM family methyltransferase
MLPSTKRIIYPLAKTIARPLGLYPFPNTLRSHLLDILRVLQINCVLDVGGHYGEFGKLLRGIGFKGTIISFEPVSASFRRLQQCAANDPRWQTLQYALGNEDMTATINLHEASEFNSLLPSDPNTISRLAGCAVENGTETVSVRRLDVIFSELNFQMSDPVIFLKMDTQGYDKSVVEGSVGVLGSIAAMQSELPETRYYLGQPAMLETLAYYHSLGFDPTGFFAPGREDDGITVIEWDVVLARPNRPTKAIKHPSNGH